MKEQHEPSHIRTHFTSIIIPHIFERKNLEKIVNHMRR